MVRCPSQDWDRYCRDQELPEKCYCGKPNCDEDGEWLCKDAEGFCSLECYKNYLEDVESDWDFYG